MLSNSSWVIVIVLSGCLAINAANNPLKNKGSSIPVIVLSMTCPHILVITSLGIIQKYILSSFRSHRILQCPRLFTSSAFIFHTAFLIVWNCASVGVVIRIATLAPGCARHFAQMGAYLREPNFAESRLITSGSGRIRNCSVGIRMFMILLRLLYD